MVINRFIMSAACIAACVLSMAQPLPKLHVEGSNLVDPQGNKVILKGTNLGCWDVVEFWMLGLSEHLGVPKDQFGLEALLSKRFGEKEKDRLMDLYRSSWITDRDFDIIRSFKFNLVRLPMNYRLMEDDRNPFHLKPDAWKWIDRAVDLSEKNGLYIILDMHGAQGGQSPYDHTGHADQNHLKDNPTDQKRLAWLWGEIAQRYKDRSAVVAYDLFNEPYGMPKDVQVSVFKQCYAEVRKYDPDKLIFAMGNWDDFYHYGDPKANGWHNVGFQMHYYPGLFGGGAPTVRTHMQHIEQLKDVAQRLEKLDVPFYIGEMNVVFNAAGGPTMMRRYFDIDASHGWLTTMWSYKVLSENGGVEGDTWAMVSNTEPRRVINFQTAPLGDIEAYFKHFATEPLSVNEKLREALSDPNFVPPPLGDLPPKMKTAPQGSIPGWSQADIGGPLIGGCKDLGNGAFDLYGGGADVWGDHDQFRLLYKEVDGDFDLQVTIDGLADVDQYTKAGLMVRASLDSKSAMALISTFPTGEVQFAHRDKDGADAQGLQTVSSKIPGLHMRLVRKGGKLLASYAGEDGAWKAAGSLPDKLPKHLFVGVMALSHDDTQLTKVSYRALELK